MRAIDIKVGENYRLKSTKSVSWNGHVSYYGYVKALQVLRPKEFEKEYPFKQSPFPYIVVKCEHTVNENENGFTKYFKPVDMIKE